MFGTKNTISVGFAESLRDVTDDLMLASSLKQGPLTEYYMGNVTGVDKYRVGHEAVDAIHKATLGIIQSGINTSPGTLRTNYGEHLVATSFDQSSLALPSEQQEQYGADDELKKEVHLVQRTVNKKFKKQKTILNAPTVLGNNTSQLGPVGVRIGNLTYLWSPVFIPVSPENCFSEEKVYIPGGSFIDLEFSQLDTAITPFRNLDWKDQKRPYSVKRANFIRFGNFLLPKEIRIQYLTELGGEVFNGVSRNDAARTAAYDNDSIRSFTAKNLAHQLQQSTRARR